MNNRDFLSREMIFDFPLTEADRWPIMNTGSLTTERGKPNAKGLPTNRGVPWQVVQPPPVRQDSRVRERHVQYGLYVAFGMLPREERAMYICLAVVPPRVPGKAGAVSVRPFPLLARVRRARRVQALLAETQGTLTYMRMHIKEGTPTELVCVMVGDNKRVPTAAVQSATLAAQRVVHNVYPGRFDGRYPNAGIIGRTITPRVS